MNVTSLSRRPLTLAVLLCLCGPVSHAWAQAKAPQSKAQAIDSIAVVVNDEVITRRELAERMDIVEKRMRAQRMEVPERTVLQERVLEQMIIERARMQAAAEVGIRVDDIALDRAVARIAENNKMSLQEFRNTVEREGTPFARFREEIREEIVGQRLREREVDSRIVISDSEVDNFLAAEAANVKTQEEINLAQITIRIPENASPEVIAERRARAEEAWRQLRSGADFAKIAASYSDSPDALKGGELGYRSTERLPPQFLEAVANLKNGQITPIMKSTGGFHIVKVVDRRTTETKPASAAVTQTHVRHILIKPGEGVSAAEARRKLLDLKARIESKADKFEDLAKTFSVDGSASKGGDLGWVYPDDPLVPEFLAAMNALQPGQLSEPVESAFGLHLIEVLERKTEDLPQDRKRMAARQVMRERRIEEAAEEWLRQLRDRTYVEFRKD